VLLQACDDGDQLKLLAGDAKGFDELRRITRFLECHVGSLAGVSH